MSAAMMSAGAAGRSLVAQKARGIFGAPIPAVAQPHAAVKWRAARAAPLGVVARGARANQARSRREEQEAKEEEAFRARMVRKRPSKGNSWGQNLRKPKEEVKFDPIEGRALLPGEVVIDFGREGRGEMCWYGLNVKPQRETTVQKLVMQVKAELEKEHFEETGQKKVLVEECVLLVKPRKTRSNATGKTLNVNEKVMPGFLLIRCIMSTKLHFKIDNSQMVLGFMGSDGLVSGSVKANYPIPLPDERVTNLFKLIEPDEEEVAEDKAIGGEDSGLKAGDIIRLIAGPFKEFAGEVYSVDAASGTAVANLAILGTDTQVSVDIKHCKVIPSNAI